MLVLTRRAGEGILVGRDIEIVVMGIEGSHVRIGIRAPRDVAVFRKELLREVRLENRRAVASGGVALLNRFGPREGLPDARPHQGPPRPSVPGRPPAAG